MHSERQRRPLGNGYPMKVMEHFEQVGSRGFYRPVAQCTFEHAVDVVAQAIQAAREMGLADLLVNTTGLTGYAMPSVFARYAMATRWAETAGASLRVALVARPELIDPQKIGVLIMQNRGGTGDVFTNEADALDWLDARLGPGQRTPSFLNRGRAND